MDKETNNTSEITSEVVTKYKEPVTKLVESNLPPEVRVHVVHLHKGNSSRSQRRGKEFVSIARLYGKNNELLGQGKAMCSVHDNPTRRVGRQVAVGRAMSNMYKQLVQRQAIESYLDRQKHVALSNLLTNQA